MFLLVIYYLLIWELGRSYWNNCKRPPYHFYHVDLFNFHSLVLILHYFLYLSLQGANKIHFIQHLFPAPKLSVSTNHSYNQKYMHIKPRFMSTRICPQLRFTWDVNFLCHSLLIDEDLTLYLLLFCFLGDALKKLIADDGTRHSQSKKSTYAHD